MAEAGWTLETPNGWQITVPESKVRETLASFQNSRELTSEEKQKAEEVMRSIYRKSDPMR